MDYLKNFLLSRMEHIEIEVNKKMLVTPANILLLKQQIFDDGRLILTVPFIIFIILRQLYLSKINHILIQKNEFYKDKLTAIAIISYSIFTLILLYTDFYSNFILTNL